MCLKVVVAVNSFKGSLGSLEIGQCIKDSILEINPLIDVVVKGVADGGEGTIDALANAYQGEIFHVEVNNAYMEKTDCRYLLCEDKKMAVIEVAEIVGLAKCQRREPRYASSYGIGEVIQVCLDKGVREFIIGLGGSATNDAGIGMLQALGLKVDFKDVYDLLNIRKIDISALDPRLQECQFTLASDVTNPLCGKLGATAIFGRQKGVKEDEVALLDNALNNFANMVQCVLGKDLKNAKGAGAAGGLGYAFLTFMSANMQSGAKLVMEAQHLEEEIKTADLVITGEGCIDEQTSMGKIPMIIAQIAKKYDVLAIGIGGSIQQEASSLHTKGMIAYFSIQCEPHSLQKAMQKEVTKAQLRLTTQEIIRLILFYCKPWHIR